MTTVISVRGRNRAELLADPSFAYVGRRCAGWAASPFGNPFKPGIDPMEAMRILDKVLRVSGGSCRMEFDGPLKIGTALECFERYINAAINQRATKSRADWRRGVLLLKGKRLGCWCGDWKPGEPEIGCHAVILAKLADSLVEETANV